LTDGNIAITADVFDLADNPATQATKTLIKETVVPTLAIDNPLMTDNLVNEAEKTAVVISGTSNAEDGQTVTLWIIGSTTLNATATVTGGVWTYPADISAMADGNIAITADVSDLAGNPATQATRTLNKDTVYPTLTIDNNLMGDDWVNPQK